MRHHPSQYPGTVLQRKQGCEEGESFIASMVAWPTRESLLIIHGVVPGPRYFRRTNAGPQSRLACNLLSLCLGVFRRLFPSELPSI
jgi:hypothetical protein